MGLPAQFAEEYEAVPSATLGARSRAKTKHPSLTRAQMPPNSVEALVAVQSGDLFKLLESKPSSAARSARRPSSAASISKLQTDANSRPSSAGSYGTTAEWVTEVFCLNSATRRPTSASSMASGPTRPWLARSSSASSWDGGRRDMGGRSSECSRPSGASESRRPSSAATPSSEPPFREGSVMLPPAMQRSNRFSDRSCWMLEEPDEDKLRRQPSGSNWSEAGSEATSVASFAERFSLIAATELEEADWDPPEWWLLLSPWQRAIWQKRMARHGKKHTRDDVFDAANFPSAWRPLETTPPSSPPHPLVPGEPRSPSRARPQTPDDIPPHLQGVAPKVAKETSFVAKAIASLGFAGRLAAGGKDQRSSSSDLYVPLCVRLGKRPWGRRGAALLKPGGLSRAQARKVHVERRHAPTARKAAERCASTSPPPQRPKESRPASRESRRPESRESRDSGECTSAAACGPSRSREDAAGLWTRLFGRGPGRGISGAVAAPRTKDLPARRLSEATEDERRREYEEEAQRMIEQAEAVLSETEKAPLQERRRHLRNLQRLLHPDKNPSSREAATLAFQWLATKQSVYMLP